MSIRKIKVRIMDVTSSFVSFNYLSSNARSRVKRKKFVNDFQNELHYCYENRTQFISTWASLSAQRGLDLSLMARDDSRDTSTILFGYTRISE